MINNIVVFGTSTGAEEVLGMLNMNAINIVSYIDNDVEKQGRIFKQKKISAPANISDLNYHYVIIASFTYEKEMLRVLEKNGVERSKILTPLSKIKGRKISYYKEKYEEYLCYSKIFNGSSIVSMFNDHSYSSTNDSNSKQRSVFLYDYPDYGLKGVDYVRASTVELLAREINENNIKGSIAELGVYRGDFTKLLSDLFKKRKIYLFDTFEGFSEKDILIEREFNFSNACSERFKDTSLEIVLNKIQDHKRLIIKKGYFPETIADLENEAYAFVSIDVDLFKPTYEGLKYFYDRLTPGGYIIVHDYNFDTYSGVKKAVRKFSREEGISYVPINDYFGSVVITK